MTDTFNLFLWVAYFGILFFGVKQLYYQATEPFREQMERTKELLKVSEACDGCGEKFNYKLHDHYGYRSCSVSCDDFLNDVFQDMN